MKRFLRFIARLFKPGENKSAYADAGDFLRVISIAFIAWFHIWQQSWLDPNIYIGRSRINLYPMVSCGYMLVDLMLLLSGFLLMLGISTAATAVRGIFTSPAQAAYSPAIILRSLSCSSPMRCRWACSGTQSRCGAIFYRI